MATVTERIAQLKLRAAERGLATVRSAPAAFRPVEPREVIERAPAAPARPIDLACRKAPPQAWKRYHGREYGVVATLKAVETRVIAKLVAHCLPGWTAEFREGRDSYYLRHVESGARLSFSMYWRDDGRFVIRPEVNCHKCELSSEITVSGTRTPASIAADITNRIINRGLIAEHLAQRAESKADRREDVEERLKVLRVARSYGGDIAPERHWNRSRPCGTRRVSPNEKARIDAALEYYGVAITIETGDLELAEAVGRLFAEYCNRK